MGIVFSFCLNRVSTGYYYGELKVNLLDRAVEVTNYDFLFNVEGVDVLKIKILN